MKIILLFILLLLPSLAWAGYVVVQIPKITPQYVVVQGPHITETVLNPGTERNPPLGAVRLIYSDVSGLYGDDPTKRVELWESTAGTASDAEIFAACTGLTAWKEAEIRAAGNAKLLAIATPYQPAERETWAIQISEAEKWLLDNTAATPMIDAIYLGRAIPKSILVSYIMENNSLFRQASGAILGQQQALLERARSATTINELLGVTW
jgi:hypothetical protein